MPRRKDALLGASRVVDLVNRIGLDNAPFACATVGMMQVHPNSRNVIPGRVFFTVDFRHPDDAVLARMDAALREGVARIAGEIGLQTELEQIFYYEPVRFDAACVASVRAAAQHMEIATGGWEVVSQVPQEVGVVDHEHTGVNERPSERVCLRSWRSLSADWPMQRRNRTVPSSSVPVLSLNG